MYADTTVMPTKDQKKDEREKEGHGSGNPPLEEILAGSGFIRNHI
jgi:hypothetical protein